ncbi:hypothetical protein [Bariatricus massiliensis]|uniref:hypothetical protein n=1 Tax=Bariatricus massiliensis TaxID=1745713 RepID=UPI0008325F52|nr:hypothetical protein [Bariatricus massiliensis]
MSKNMIPRVCKSCECSFIGGPRAWYCPACRVERKKDSQRKMREAKKSNNYIPLGSPITCELCGAIVIKNSGNQRYCPKCAKEHLKLVDNAQSLEWKRANPEKIKEGKRNLSKKRHAGEGRKSGVKYISWDKGAQKWRVMPFFNGKQYHVGRFSSLEEAAEKLNEFMSEKTNGQNKNSP